MKFVNGAIISIKWFCMHVNVECSSMNDQTKQERENIPFSSFCVCTRDLHSSRIKFFALRYRPHTTNHESENIGNIWKKNYIRNKIKWNEQPNTHTHVYIYTHTHTLDRTRTHRAYIEVSKLWRCPIKVIAFKVSFSLSVCSFGRCYCCYGFV